MYRARKPKVKGTRRKGGLKVRGKGKPGQAKGATTPNQMMGEAPQMKIKGMGPNKNTHAGAGKGKPKGKARVGVTNPLGLPRVRKANRPMGNPLPMMGGMDAEQRLRRHAQKHPFNPADPRARQKRQNFYGRMAMKPKMGMTSQLRVPRRRGY